ncbi:MAG: J domain-containing protein [Acidimicrobiales bacterium]
MDHYDALELTSSAQPDEIRAAYLKLARRYHPDSHPDAAPAERRRNEQRMQEVTAAWAVLGDAERRRVYDQQRPQPTRSRSRATHTAGRADDPYRFVPFDLDDDPPMPDTDPEGRRTHSRGLSMAPVLLLMAAIACLIVGAMTGLAPLLALGLGSFAASIVLFIVVPLVALTSSQRDDRL